ncbi:MAG: hypothetical protein ACYSUV_02045 [Planctomycetota bacterium]|jgi:hypothetical protein
MKEYKKPFEVGVLYWIGIANWAIAAIFFIVAAFGLFLAIWMPESKSTTPFPWHAVSESFHYGVKTFCIGYTAFWVARLVDKVHETHHIVKQLEIHK